MAKQIRGLVTLVARLKKKYPKAEVIGHNEVAKKDCPCINFRAEYA